MIKITQEFDNNRDASNSLKAVDYWASLFDLDEWLREQVKYSHLTSETYDAYDKVREKINSIMDRHGVNLLDYD